MTHRARKKISEPEANGDGRLYVWRNGDSLRFELVMHRRCGECGWGKLGGAQFIAEAKLDLGAVPRGSKLGDALAQLPPNWWWLVSRR